MRNEVDNLIVFIYDNEIYYYEKNIQGDIIAIKDYMNELIARYTNEAANNVKLASKDNVIKATNKPNRTFPMKEKATINEDLIYKSGKTIPKDIMCPATRSVTNQNGWEYEVGKGKTFKLESMLGQFNTSRTYVERVDETGTSCYYRTTVSLGINFIYDISVTYENEADCTSGKKLGVGYLTYDESIGPLHLSDGKISLLLGGGYDSSTINSFSVSGGYRVYAFGGR